jgi:hypothetical protein
MCDYTSPVLLHVSAVITCHLQGAQTVHYWHVTVEGCDVFGVRSSNTFLLLAPFTKSEWRNSSELCQKWEKCQCYEHHVTTFNSYVRRQQSVLPEDGESPPKRVGGLVKCKSHRKRAQSWLIYSLQLNCLYAVALLNSLERTVVTLGSFGSECIYILNMFLTAERYKMVVNELTQFCHQKRCVCCVAAGVNCCVFVGQVQTNRLRISPWRLTGLTSSWFFSLLPGKHCSLYLGLTLTNHSVFLINPTHSLNILPF